MSSTVKGGYSRPERPNPYFTQLAKREIFSLFVGILVKNCISFDAYYNARLLRWAGHVARMPMDRMPRRLLTGWVKNRRLVGAPQMTFGRTLNKALRAKGLPTTFAGARGWQRLAQDRVTWRERTRA